MWQFEHVWTVCDSAANIKWSDPASVKSWHHMKFTGTLSILDLVTSLIPIVLQWLLRARFAAVHWSFSNPGKNQDRTPTSGCMDKLCMHICHAFWCCSKCTPVKLMSLSLPPPPSPNLKFLRSVSVPWHELPCDVLLSNYWYMFSNYM